MSDPLLLRVIGVMEWRAGKPERVDLREWQKLVTELWERIEHLEGQLEDERLHDD